MYMEVGFVLARFAAIVLEHVHALGAKGNSCRPRHLA